ncbi:MAG: hypothetical protein LBV71_18720 [Prevotella sp.]|jgi:hypothetical protein|nr:hypothetical protein [Prevotella sp.]
MEDKEIKTNQQASQAEKSEAQQKIDNQLKSEPFKDMHLESGEKINEYEED